MCSSRLDILFTEPTHRQSLLHCERHAPKHIQTSLADSTVKLIYLSIAPPACLSSNSFYHSTILFSVCLHSSVIIRPKKCNTYFLSFADKALYTSFRSKLWGPPKDTHTSNSVRSHLNYTIISFVVIFLSKSSEICLCCLFCLAKRQIIILQSRALLCARDLLCHQYSQTSCCHCIVENFSQTTVFCETLVPLWWHGWEICCMATRCYWQWYFCQRSP